MYAHMKYHIVMAWFKYPCVCVMITDCHFFCVAENRIFHVRQPNNQMHIIMEFDIFKKIIFIHKMVKMDFQIKVIFTLKVFKNFVIGKMG